MQHAMAVSDGDRALARLAGPWIPSREQIAGLASVIADVERRARARTLSLREAEAAVRRYCDIARLVGASDLAGITVEAHGGRVTNNYGYGADATWLTIRWAPPGGLEGRTGIYVARHDALSGPRGAGWTCRARIFARSRIDDLDEIDGVAGRRERHGPWYVVAWRW